MNAIYCMVTQIETDTEKRVCHDFTRFGDSSTAPNLLKLYIVYIRAYLDTT